MAKKGLGRGFNSLIPDDLFDESFDPTSEDDHSVSQLRILKLASIKTDSEQPRKHFDEAALAELAASIEQHGILQPIVVTPRDGSYVIVAGERRYRASLAAGKDTIPALVRTIDGQQQLELALIENLQRRDLNALETAVAYAKLRDQFNMSLDAIGRSVGGKSVSAISNTLRLLKLPHAVQQAIAEGILTEGQARPLIDADSALIDELLPKIIAEGWSARLIEQTVRTKKPAKTDKKHIDRPDYTEISERIAKKLRAPVAISSTAKGSGKIAISFKNQEELTGILDYLGSKE